MWTRLLTCAEIAAEIEKGLGILSTTLHNVPERHRSLRAVFDSSWGLLAPDEQLPFRRLAVFRGGFEREAAEQVAGVTLEPLSALVDKSLLQWAHTRRYDQHELNRQSTLPRTGGRRRKLSALAACRLLSKAGREHPEPALRRGLARPPGGRTPQSARGARLELFSETGAAPVEIGLKLVSALGAFWWLRGLSEGRTWSPRCWSAHWACRRRPPGRRRSTWPATWRWNRTATSSPRARYTRRAFSLQTALGDKQGAAVSLLGLGAAGRPGDLPTAALVFRTRPGHLAGTRRAVGHRLGGPCIRGIVHFSNGGPSTWRVRSRTNAGRSGGRWVTSRDIAWICNMLGETERYQARYEPAKARYEES